MTNTVAVNFKMDKATKLAMERICENLGINLTNAFNIFAKAVVRNHGIPFELVEDPFYSEVNQKRLRKSIKQLENKGGKVHEVIHGKKLV
jgi:DNA-damage-inducible protein J